MIPVGNVIRFLTTKPDPVPLAAPADGLTLNTLAPRLWWHTPPGIDSVRVLVATDVTFSNVVVDRSVQEHYLDTPELDLRMTYYWRVIYRQAPWSDTWSFSIPEYVGIENDEGELPTVLSITSVFPNPIESSFTVSVGMPAAGTVGIDLYDALGRRVQPSAGEDRSRGMAEHILGQAEVLGSWGLLPQSICRWPDSFESSGDAIGAHSRPGAHSGPRLTVRESPRCPTSFGNWHHPEAGIRSSPTRADPHRYSRAQSSRRSRCVSQALPFG